MAQGILDIINARMADAIRTITIRRGIDPRDFSLFAYGGAGPMHAVALAEELEIGEVIVAVHPGAFSAWGMLQTDVKHELKQTYYGSGTDVMPPSWSAAIGAGSAGPRTPAQGGDRRTSDISFLRSADFRYEGQEYQINCAMPAGEGRQGGRARSLRRGLLTGNTATPTRRRASRVAIARRGDRQARPAGASPTPKPASGRTGAHAQGLFRRQAVRDRDRRARAACAGDVVAGPAIIEEPTATTILPPGWRAEIDRRRPHDADPQRRRRAMNKSRPPTRSPPR